MSAIALSHRLTVRRYCAAIFVAGCAVAAAMAGTIDFRYPARHTLAFALLSAGVVLGELLPVKIPRRGNDEEIVLSTSFSLALLMLGGLGPAMVAQGSASVLQDLLARKPWWRIRFNVGQYMLSMAAALIVMELLSGGPRIGEAHPFTSGQLPAMLVSAAVFFVVNTGIVGVAVALYQGVPVGPYFRHSVFFVVVTASVLLFLAPIVIAAAAYSVFLIPLFAAPMFAMFRAGREASRSDYAARHDGLTGLTNRVAFREAVDHAIRDGGQPSCVLLMDLDRFKEVNDTLGHRYGDLLLCRVAERLRARLQTGDQIARLGGDEFAIFGPRPDGEAALRFAHSVAESLRAPFELEQFVVDAQASIGVAVFPDDGSDVDTLLQKADVAMYRAKATHGDVGRYDARHDTHSAAKLALTADLRTALQSEEIVVWYQPEIDLRTKHVNALEALVRWEHPALGLLGPASFLDMAEHTNLIKPLTQRVLDVALRQLREWHEAGLDVAVAVNVSTRVLVDEEFTERVVRTLEKAAIPPCRLKLEVTESTLMADPELARSVLGELSALGIEISIDDFGTGYSSLAYLADLPVSEVKIDRTFVGRMSTDSREAIIVSSTVELAQHLGLRTVAEGVENAALLDELQALGCDSVQGYAISRPLDRHDATRWLVEQKKPRAADDSTEFAARLSSFSTGA